MLESAIQTKIIKYLEGQGAYVARVITAGKAGTADLLVSYRGHFIAVEVKTPKGRVAPLQEYHQGLVKKAGGISIIARSVDDVKLLLTSLGPSVE